MKERIIWIDQLKGIAILQVVIGHILWFPMGFRNVVINKCLLLNFIYSFHMPLFIFLSGIVIKSVPDIKKLLSKLLQFLCPLLLIDHYFLNNGMNLSFLHDYFADSLNTILLAFFSLLVSILVAYSSIFIGKVIRSMELSKIVYGNFFK